ncbi:AgrD family cyclic lactone autoinducer peptide [Paenibacillus montanisoli]|nr:cyclic lactone autoinducer peptide [Paenibacillus montanisoli]
MQKKAYQVLAAAIIGISSLFVLTGSYFLLHQPRIPQELRKKGV